MASSDCIAHASSQETCEVVLDGLVINNDFSPLCTGEIMSQSRATSKTVPWNSAKDSFMCHKLEAPPETACLRFSQRLVGRARSLPEAFVLVRWFSY